MNPDERFEQLWTDFLEGDLAPEGMAELQRLLAEHPQLQAQAADLLQTHRLLGFSIQDGEASQNKFTRSTLAGLPKSNEAFVGAVMRDVKTAAPARTRVSWLKRYSSIAAGFVFGIICASVAWACTTPHFGKTIALMQEGFESGPAPRVTGIPIEPGCWSGDFTEIVGEQHGVKPASGIKMLRFLRADYEGKANSEGSYVSDVYRLIDLRPYRNEFNDGGAVVQVSVALNAYEFPENEAYFCTVALHALDAETATNGSTRSAETLNSGCLAMARNSRMKLDRNPATWQRLSSELRLPPATDFLLIHIGVGHATKAQRKESFDGHYLDDVRISLTQTAPLQ